MWLFEVFTNVVSIGRYYLCEHVGKDAEGGPLQGLGNHGGHVGDL